VDALGQIWNAFAVDHDWRILFHHSFGFSGRFADEVCQTEKLSKRGYLHILILYTTIFPIVCIQSSKWILVTLLALVFKAGRERYPDYGASTTMSSLNCIKMHFQFG
jgi:hypothetical protein